jgi:hypothetical protein
MREIFHGLPRRAVRACPLAKSSEYASSKEHRFGKVANERAEFNE